MAAGYSREVVAGVLRRAEEEGLLNDQVFARLWVTDRLEYRPLSRRAVAKELREKGVAPEVIAATMEEHYPAEEEKGVALSLARERLERMQGLEREARLRRTIAYLIRRGFAPGTSAEIVRALERDRA